MILVSIILLLAAYVVFPLVMTSDAVKVIKKTGDVIYRIPTVGAVYDFETLFAFVLMLFVIGVGVMLVTLAKKQGLVVLGIGMSGVSLAFLLPDLLNFLNKLDMNKQVTTDTTVALFIPVILFGIVFIYSLVFGIIRLIHSFAKQTPSKTK